MHIDTHEWPKGEIAAGVRASSGIGYTSLSADMNAIFLLLLFVDSIILIVTNLVSHSSSPFCNMG